MYLTIIVNELGEFVARTQDWSGARITNWMETHPEHRIETVFEEG